MRARGVASSSTHCGRKSSGAVRKDDEYCALSSSAAAAVAIGQLQLRLSHYSLVALYRLFASRNVTSRGPRGGLGKKFSRLAIARHIFLPPHELFYNSTTADGDSRLQSKVPVV